MVPTIGIFGRIGRASIVSAQGEAGIFQKKCYMIYAHKYFILIAVTSALLLFACQKEECDFACANVDNVHNFAFLDLEGNSLLNTDEPDAVKINSIKSLTTPDRQMDYDIIDTLDGTFPVRVSLLNIHTSDLYILDSNQVLQNKVWV